MPAGLAVLAAVVLATFAAGASARSGANDMRRGPALDGKRISLKALKRPASTLPVKFREANPKQAIKVAGTFKRLATIKPIRDLGDFGRLDSKGRSDARKGRPHPKLRAPQSRAAANDLVLFRNQPISDSGLGSSTNEPSVGNDRNAIFFTGNWYTAYSSNNGIDFQFVDPKALTSPGTNFCCDQVVNASDEDDDELVAWLLQYAVGGDTNTIRLATYDGRADLLTTVASLTPCVYDFQPEDFDLDDDRRFDYNAMESSAEWLYVSTNVYTISKNSDGNATAKGDLVWRVKLDDLTDGDCRLSSGYEWVYDDDSQSARLVDGAGSTMYWASHEDRGSTIRIWKLADSSTTWSSHLETLTTWSAGGYTCTVSDTDKHNPCADNDSRITAGWRSGDELGFLWSAGSGGAFDWPYVRGARFKTSDRSLKGEIVLYNDDYGIQNPSAGVNANGDVGVIFYRMGGSYHPSPRVFMVDSVTPSWSGVDTTGIKTGKYSPDENRWGDYATISAYDGCSNTFLATAYTLEYGEDHTNDAQPRVVWFGREKHGCPDLVVESFAYAYSSTLEKLLLADTTRNVGGVETGTTSETRFYLSKDDDYDSSDLRIYADPEHDVPDLDDGDDSPFLTVAPVPTRARSSESYYVLACADATERVDEVSDSNNCAVDDDRFTVPATTPTISKKDLSMFVVHADARPQFQPGGPIKITDDVRISADEAVPAVVRYYLSATRFLDDTRIELGIREIPGWDKIPNPPKPTPIPVWKSVKTTNLTIPKSVQPGVYFLVACVEPKTALAEKSATNNCRATVSFRVFPPR